MMTMEEKAKFLSDIFAVTDIIPEPMKEKVEGIVLGVALAHELTKNKG